MERGRVVSGEFEGVPRIVGKDGAAIESLRDWRVHGAPAGGKRQWQPDRSAWEAAEAWIAFTPVLALLASHQLTGGFQPALIEPEARLPLDDRAGNTRNTDVLAYGTAGGRRVLVAVEAKAGEPYGSETVEQALVRKDEKSQ